MSFIKVFKIMHWNKIVSWVGFVCTVLGVLLYFVPPWNNSKSDLIIRDYMTPVSVNYSKNYAEIKSKLGSTISSVILDHEIIDYQIIDLDCDGKQEIVFSIGDDSKVEKLDVRTYDGRLVFQYSCVLGKLFDGGTSYRYYIKDLMIIGDKKKSIIVHCRDWNGWYQTYIEEINFQGNVIGRYLHPGHLWNPEYAKIGNYYYSVWTGVNNDLSTSSKDRMGVLFCIKHPIKSGKAPPHAYKGEQGSQVWYKVIRPEGVEIKKIEFINANYYRKYFSCWTEYGKIFFISKDGKILEESVADNGNPNASLSSIVLRNKHVKR
ncbi:MAG: hypothetical protein PF692_08965 [Kiritimatiellae bacterium]|jgi:hypothetical protein|nr:hypothetical protein [Kiritimatiellia bacterium]